MISIIIPLYNVEQYILHCLQSLERQTYRDFEVIVVDDGSTDGSAGVVRDYISRSQMHLSLHSQLNQGVSAARNKGMQYANGDYICFIDSDDMLDDRYLEIMMRELSDENADMCVCGHVSRVQEDNSERHFDESYDKTLYTKQEALSKLLYNKNALGIWSVLCKRELLGDLRFLEGCRFSEDLEMVWKLTARSKRIVEISAPLYLYRLRSSSAMTVIDDRRLDGLKAFLGLEDFMRVNAPEFSQEFEQYAVAKWVWSTVWQVAHGVSSYHSFKKSVVVYQPRLYMKRLLGFKTKKVSFSAFIYLYAKPLYYALVKFVKRKYRATGG